MAGTLARVNKYEEGEISSLMLFEGRVRHVLDADLFFAVSASDPEGAFVKDSWTERYLLDERFSKS